MLKSLKNNINECGLTDYSQTSLIRTPKGQNQVSALQRCPYYRGRECMIFGISGTKRTVRNREVSVRRGLTVIYLRYLDLYLEN